MTIAKTDVSWFLRSCARRSRRSVSAALAGPDPFVAGPDPFVAGPDPFVAGPDPFVAGPDPFVETAVTALGTTRRRGLAFSCSARIEPSSVTPGMPSARLRTKAET